MSEAGWTTDKPTVEGWYWIRDSRFVLSGGVKPVYITTKDLTMDWGSTAEWLGPITPESYAAGRVAGIKEVQQYAHDECFVPCAGKDFWQRGHNAAALHIFNYCQKLIEQQAQGDSVRCCRCGGSGYTQSDDPARPLSRCGTCQGDGRYQPSQAQGGGEHG